MGRNFRDHICHSKLKHYFIFMVFQNICLVPLEQRQKGNYSVVVKSFCCGSVQLGISVLPLLAQRAWLFLCFSLFDCKMKLVIIPPHSVVEGIERDDAWKVWHRAWKKTLNDTQQLFLYGYIVGELVEKFFCFFFFPYFKTKTQTTVLLLLHIRRVSALEVFKRTISFK